MTVRTMASGGIDLVRGAEVNTVRMWGEIDAALRNQAGVALAGALESDRPVVVETSDVAFIDSSGAAFLVQLCALGRKEGVPVRLTNPPSAVAEVLHLAGCDDALVWTSAA